MTNADPPALEMLWEGHDPCAVLTERFGFRDATAAGEWVTSTVRSQWGVDASSCERIVMSFTNALAWLRTSDGRFLAKWSIAPHRFGRLTELTDLVAWLDRQGQPVSASIPAGNGRHQVETDGVSIGLQRVVDGELLDVADPAQVHTAGAVLAQLHQAMQAYPKAAQVPGLTAPTTSLTERITARFAESRPQLARTPVEALLRTAAQCPRDRLPAQLVHGDFRAANLLCHGPEIVAVLDFEETRLDHRVLDLARSAVLLGTRFHHWGPVTPQVRAQFLAGYQAVSRLTPDEAAWWNALVLWFSLEMVPDGDDPTGWGAAALEAAATARAHSSDSTSPTTTRR